MGEVTQPTKGIIGTIIGVIVMVGFYYVTNEYLQMDPVTTMAFLVTLFMWQLQWTFCFDNWPVPFEKTRGLSGLVNTVIIFVLVILTHQIFQFWGFPDTYTGLVMAVVFIYWFFVFRLWLGNVHILGSAKTKFQLGQPSAGIINTILAAFATYVTLSIWEVPPAGIAYPAQWIYFGILWSFIAFWWPCSEWPQPYNGIAASIIVGVATAIGVYIFDLIGYPVATSGEALAFWILMTAYCVAVFTQFENWKLINIKHPGVRLITAAIITLIATLVTYYIAFDILYLDYYIVSMWFLGFAFFWYLHSYTWGYWPFKEHFLMGVARPTTHVRPEKTETE